MLPSAVCGGCGLLWSADWSEYDLPCEKCGAKRWRPVDNPVDSLPNPRAETRQTRTEPGIADHDPWEGPAMPDLIPPAYDHPFTD